MGADPAWNSTHNMIPLPEQVLQVTKPLQPQIQSHSRREKEAQSAGVNQRVRRHLWSSLCLHSSWKLFTTYQWRVVFLWRLGTQRVLCGPRSPLPVNQTKASTTHCSASSPLTAQSFTKQSVRARPTPVYHGDFPHGSVLAFPSSWGNHTDTGHRWEKCKKAGFVKSAVLVFAAEETVAGGGYGEGQNSSCTLWA